LFESGVGAGTGAVVIPIIIDDLPFTALGAPLSMYQSVRMDNDGLQNLAERISKETRTKARPQSLTKRVLPNISEAPKGTRTTPGIYLGTRRTELDGWHAYVGDPRNLESHKGFISIGKSFADGFRYPASDYLEAPWRYWGFRLKRTQGVHIYASVKCLDGSDHKIYVTTNANVWGVASIWLDEFIVPAPFIPKDEWKVVIVNMGSVERKFASPIHSITSFLARGPLMLSHIWCVDEAKQIPKIFREDAIHLIYPGATA
jgi:hypothetical protein